MNFITRWSKIIPWQFKILLKLIFSHFNIDYNVWRKLGVFKHGNMEKPDYALTTFLYHFNRVSFTNKHSGFTSLEIGPGDSLFSAILSRIHNGKKNYLVDTGHYAEFNLENYRHFLLTLKEQGEFCIPDKIPESEAELLEQYNSQYLIDGIHSLKKIPNSSVDFIWSQAVLEHIRKDQFFEFLKEVRRILSPGGVCSHRIDLKDHIGGGINHLRFSERVWESSFMANSGFYTNRYRFGDMINLFSKAGFRVEVVGIDSWECLPIKKRKLYRDYRDISDSDLCISGFDVILR